MHDIRKKFCCRHNTKNKFFTTTLKLRSTHIKKSLYVHSDDTHETTYEETKTPATYTTYQSPEPIIKKTVVNRELVSNNISIIANIFSNILICYFYRY